MKPGPITIGERSAARALLAASMALLGRGVDERTPGLVVEEGAPRATGAGAEQMGAAS